MLTETSTSRPSSLGTFLAPKTVAHMLGLQPRAIYKAIDAGELRAFKFRNRLRVNRDDLQDYVERCAV